METTTRGSERLLEQLGVPDQISDETLKSIIGVARKHDAEILDWCQFGQSKGIESVCGSFQVQPAQAGALVDDFFKLPGWDCKLVLRPVGLTGPTAIQVELTGGMMARS